MLWCATLCSDERTPIFLWRVCLVHVALWLQVLEDLLAENDGVLDVWHLLGLSYYSGGLLEEAAEVCKTGMQLMKSQQVGPEEGIALAFDDLHSAITEAQAAAAGEQQS